MNVKRGIYGRHERSLPYSEYFRPLIRHSARRPSNAI